MKLYLRIELVGTGIFIILGTFLFLNGSPKDTFVPYYKLALAGVVVCVISYLVIYFSARRRRN